MALNFQRISIIVAGILIIVIIVILSILLFNTSNSQVWPPIIPSCPDYWLDLSGNGGQCINPKGLGSCGDGPMNFTNAPYIGSNGNCAKYLWAQKCNLTWDGITYGVSNPCDVSNNTT